MGRESRPTTSPAGLPEPADALTLLARTQALTNQSLQQVAEGLTRWTDAEMKHRSKDWPVFDGQVIHYIAWNREWIAHHRENYPGLQGDALRRVPFSCSLQVLLLASQPTESAAGRSPVESLQSLFILTIPICFPS
jgi:hypothetical protein